MPRTKTLVPTGKVSARGVAFPGTHIDPAVVWLPTGPSPLDPDPAFGEEIRATHRALVEQAARRHGPEPDLIAEAVCLPVWNVRRHLHTLGLGPDPSPKPVRKTGGNSVSHLHRTEPPA